MNENRRVTREEKSSIYYFEFYDNHIMERSLIGISRRNRLSNKNINEKPKVVDCMENQKNKEEMGGACHK